MISHLLHALIWSAFAGIVTLFVGINIGLRCVSSGRHFLLAARQQGKLVASPRLSSTFGVKLIFALSYVAAILVALITWALLRTNLR